MFLFEDGVSAEDFFIYHLYELPKNKRKQFVTLHRSIKINKLVNSKCRRELVEDKRQFGEYYHDFLKRRQISTNQLSYDEFLDFYNSEKRVFAKPAFGCNGDGAFIIEENSDEATLHKAFEKITREPYVLETVLTQDGLLKKLNPHTLNTIRINVFNDHGNFRILNAILRSGQGDVVTDNICAGGCVSEIDIDTGTFITPFVDLSNHSYEKHPKTGVSLIGKKCPCWNAAAKVAIEAAKKLPGGVYTSWDIAVIRNGDIAVVEGNTWGNFNIQQVPRQLGLRERFEALVSEWKLNELRGNAAK